MTVTLRIRTEEGRSLTKTLVLEGRLDSVTIVAFDEALDAVLASPVKVVVFDLSGLDFISSAGLRSIFRAQKVMHARAGKSMLLNPTPQVRKVFEIVKMPELGVVFQNTQELDAYLDTMQKKVVEGE